MKHSGVTKIQKKKKPTQKSGRVQTLFTSLYIAYILIPKLVLNDAAMK